jgi:uncharacterized protein with HEPN domain
MHEFIIDKCEIISESIDAVQHYFHNISSSDSFIQKEQGSLYLDAIMMRLQSIGENIKKIHKLDEGFFVSVLHFDPNSIIRFRDFISHHYEKRDHEIVYDICKTDIPELKEKINNFLKGQSGK